MVIDYSYDPNRETLITSIAAQPNGNVTAPLSAATYYETYEYDTIGNITEKTQPHPNSGELGTKTYTYNGRDELTQIGLQTESFTKPSFKTYAYDKGRNITEYSIPGPGNTPRTLQKVIDTESDRLLQQETADGKVTFTYDAEGNMTEVVYYTATTQGQAFTPDMTGYTKTRTRHYAYTYHNQLESVKETMHDNDPDTPESADPTHIIAIYGYRADGLRVYSHTVGNRPHHGTKTYHYDLAGRIIGETNRSYSKATNPQTGHDYTVRYIYNGNEKVAMIRPKDLSTNITGDEVYYFINNLQGTPVKIVDSQKRAVSAINMDEWGNLGTNYLGQKAEVNFTGKKYDEVTGLYYFGSRYYDPKLGIFLTEDPAAQLMNPYVYAGNNPMMFVDPDGEIFGAIIAGAIIGAMVNGAVAAVQGQDIGQAMFQGAVGGAISGAIFFGIGELSNSIGLASGSFAKVGLHAIGGGLSSMMMGGDFASGAIGAGISQSFAPGIDKLPNSATRIMSAAGVGALSALATGGDVAYGALAAGFARGFNDEMHMVDKALNTLDDISTAMMAAAIPLEVITAPIPGDGIVFGGIGMGLKGVAKGLKAIRAASKMKVLSKGEIKMMKKAGVDIHDIKGGVGPAKHFDLYKNKKGDIFKIRKGGRSEPDPTGLNINEFR